MQTKNTPLSWKTISKKVNDLVPQNNNPRKITEANLEKLKKSIQKFNLVEIPTIDADGKILSGHQRILALQLLGRGDEMIDVRGPNRKLTDKESKEYLLKSNIHAGEWDFDLLKDFEINTLLDAGFEQIEISKMFDDLPVKTSKEFNVKVELEKIKTPKTKLGDRILLGKHVLFCGDSTKEENVKKLMGNKLANLINTDTPYNQDLDYDKGVGGKKSKRSYGGTVNDKLTDDAFKEFVKSIMQNALKFSHPDTHAFFWCSDYYIWVLQTSYIELGLKNRRVLTWVKNNSSPTPQTAFNRATESCCYAVRGKPYLAKHITKLSEIVNDLGTGNELLDNLTNLILVKRLPSQKYTHPTEKSPEVHTNIIKRCSKIGDIVLDLTAGSGSIMSACEELGRVAYMCEINPIFCDVIVRRYELLTSKKAVYENSK